MSIRKTLGAATLALTVTLAPVYASTIAHAAPAVQTVETRQQVTKAEQYVVSHLTQGSYFVPAFDTEGDPSITIDVLLGLSASGQHNPTVQKIAAWLKTQTDYVTSAGSAAKMALAAVASGADPRDFGGKDLIDTILTEAPKLAANNAFSASLAVVALDAADVKVSDAVLTPVFRDQQADGGFKSWAQAQTSDPDTTALVIQALANHLNATTQPVFDKALKYLEGSVNADGSFPTFSPANTAGLALPALSKAKSPKADTVRQWLATHQLADGGYSNTAQGTKSDVWATAAALLALGDVSYADITMVTAPSESSGSASSTPPADSTGSKSTDSDTSTGSSSDPGTGTKSTDSNTNTGSKSTDSNTNTGSSSESNTNTGTKSTDSDNTPKSPSHPGALPDTGADGSTGIVLIAVTLVAGGVALRRITQ